MQINLPLSCSEDNIVVLCCIGVSSTVASIKIIVCRECGDVIQEILRGSIVNKLMIDAPKYVVMLPRADERQLLQLCNDWEMTLLSQGDFGP